MDECDNYRARFPITADSNVLGFSDAYEILAKINGQILDTKINLMHSLGFVWF